MLVVSGANGVGSWRGGTRRLGSRWTGRNGINPRTTTTVGIAEWRKVDAHALMKMTEEKPKKSDVQPSGKKAGKGNGRARKGDKSSGETVYCAYQDQDKF